MMMESESDRLWTKDNMVDQGIHKISYKDFKEEFPQITVDSSTFGALLHEIDQAHQSEDVLTEDEKKILFKDPAHLDYLLSAEFKKRIQSIPRDDEVEWIYMMWARLCESLYELYVYQDDNIVETIDVVVRSNKLKPSDGGGLVPDRIFGFTYFKGNDCASEWRQSQVIKEFTEEVGFPLILVEIKSYSLHSKKEENDYYKLPILEGLAYEHQQIILNHFVDDFPYTIPVPLVFGLHAVGQMMRISVHRVVEDQNFSIVFDELDYLNTPIRILKTIAVIKRALLKVYLSVGKATKMVKMNVRENKNINTTAETNEHSSISEIDEKKNPLSQNNNDEPSELSTIYENDKTSVQLGALESDSSQLVVVKTTQRVDGKNEEMVLQKLQDLQQEGIVPRLFDAAMKGKHHVALTLSYHAGIHPQSDSFGSLDEFKIFASKLLQVISRVHRKRLIHNDLKEDNIIWNSELQRVTLIDFAGATSYLRKPHIFTRGYRAPEALATPASDVYSTGVIFINLLFDVSINDHEQVRRFHECNTFDELALWLRCEFDRLAVQNFDTHALNLLTRMTRTDPTLRINIPAALKHPFFTSTQL